jgi:ABC-type sugar transport system ATPase subunit
LISSELSEVLGLAHRMLVMRGGKLVAELPGAQTQAADVLRAAAGV